MFVFSAVQVFHDILHPLLLGVNTDLLAPSGLEAVWGEGTVRWSILEIQPKSVT